MAAGHTDWDEHVAWHDTAWHWRYELLLFGAFNFLVRRSHSKSAWIGTGAEGTGDGFGLPVVVCINKCGMVYSIELYIVAKSVRPVEDLLMLSVEEASETIFAGAWR